MEADEVGYDPQSLLLEKNFCIVILVLGLLEGCMPVGRRDSYEMLQLCVSVLFLHYQDSRHLMCLVEAIEEEHSLLGRGYMFQHCGTQGGSPSGFRSLWPL